MQTYFPRVLPAGSSPFDGGRGFAEGRLGSAGRIDGGEPQDRRLPSYPPPLLLGPSTAPAPDSGPPPPFPHPVLDSRSCFARCRLGAGLVPASACSACSVPARLGGGPARCLLGSCKCWRYLLRLLCASGSRLCSTRCRLGSCSVPVPGSVPLSASSVQPYRLCARLEPARCLLSSYKCLHCLLG